MSIACPTPKEDTYASVERLIYHLCWQFYRKHGGDIDDLIQEANTVFMTVYDAFVPERGEFVDLLCVSVNHRLTDFSMHNHSRKMVSLDGEDATGHSYASQVVDQSTSDFNLQQFSEDLSQEAKLVLRLVFKTPKSVEDTIMAKGGEPRNWRSTIREYLSTNLNWSAELITESFEEILTVLHE